VLRLVQDGAAIRCKAGDVPVWVMPPTGIAGEGEAKTPAEFGRVESSRIDRHIEIAGWEIRDQIEQVTPGLFEWRRAWKNASAQTMQGDFFMEAESSYSPDFFLIPPASFNGNPAHGRTAPQGLTSNGEPWVFSAYRSTVPAANYSEGAGWSMFLFAQAQRPSMDCACSLVSKNGHMVHRLLWPVRDNIPSRINVSDRAAMAQCGSLPIGPGASFEAAVYLVVSPAPEPRKAWSKGLDSAWLMNRHDVTPWFPPKRLWALGIQFAQETLWYEEPDFVGFNLGVKPTPDGVWRQHGGGTRFEIGWCGQNASLGTSMLQDYLWNGNPESLRKGVSSLDFWAENGRLPCGLFYTHYDVKLGVSPWASYNPTFLGRAAERSERFVDTCNLGYGVYFYLLAWELAGKCGLDKPAWRQMALDTCDFFVKNALPDGTFGKAWSLEGKCLDTGATTGGHVVWAMLKAYRVTKDARYLATARRAFRAYVDRDLSHLDCWGSALDADTIDRESGPPLLLAALDLYEITGEKQYLRDAELAGYYLATWQWHYSVQFPSGSQVDQNNYDIFAGTCVGVRGPGLDPWGAFVALGWLRLAKATGNKLWRDRGIQTFNQSTIGISDGHLVINGFRRPIGGQNESMGLGIARPCGRGLESTYNDWLVAWPSALRMITLMHWSKWEDFGPQTGV
jgi:hypothetical protein